MLIIRIVEKSDFYDSNERWFWRGRGRAPSRETRGIKRPLEYNGSLVTVIMASTPEGDVRFSQWYRWNDREESQNLDHPGVYLLAHFPGVVPSVVGPESQEIVYIGETTRKQGLRKRLRQFEKSAMTGEHAHAGGRTYHTTIGQIRGDLYVAVWPVRDLNPETGPALIRYVERKLIWEYARKWGAMPRCNRK